MAGLAVHEMRRANHVPPESGSEGLVAEADPENRQFSRKMPKKLNADTSFLRGTGAGRNDDALRPHGLNFSYRDLIIPSNRDFCAKFAKILHQVVGKRVVIIQHKDHMYSHQVTSRFRTMPAIGLSSA